MKSPLNVTIEELETIASAAVNSARQRDDAKLDALFEASMTNNSPTKVQRSLKETSKSKSTSAFKQTA